MDGRRSVRRVQADGKVKIEHARYYVGHRLAGQRVALAVVADERALDVYHGDTLLKRLPLRGLRGEILLFDHYVALMEREAPRRSTAAPPTAGRLINGYRA